MTTGLALFAWPNLSQIQCSDANVTVQDSHISHYPFRSIWKPYFVPICAHNPKISVDKFHPLRLIWSYSSSLILCNEATSKIYPHLTPILLLLTLAHHLCMMDKTLDSHERRSIGNTPTASGKYFVTAMPYRCLGPHQFCHLLWKAHLFSCK